MKSFLTFFSFLFIGMNSLLAQVPTNDDCDGLIDLGAVPICEDTPTTFFTNIDATASDIGFGNTPSCFNGGTVQNDVWFGFQTTTDLIDLTISVQGTPLGPNGEVLNNPQIALYRGDCVVDGLAELFCLSAENGETSLQLDVLGLTPNTQYFLRINDYSASATPNWGDFTICIEEFVPDVNCGDSSFTSACTGTFYDSGGPDGDYSSNENCVYTICPADFHQCIELNIPFYNTENSFDQLSIFAGDDINGELIAVIQGNGNGNSFPIQVSTQCVTLQFTSDGSVQQEGFEVIWECTPLECDGSSSDNPTVIGDLPFSGDFSTCEGAATFGETACTNDGFINGPEYVFVYNSLGGLCADIQVTNGGVLVLDGPPTDPNSICVAQGPTGFISGANFQDPGDYYIVVAQADGCIDFNIDIVEADCSLSPALVDALCNPLNGCIEEGGVPSIFTFEDGFQDMEITAGVNDGCWFGVGVEPDFYWFSIEAQADGPFGFILESADNPSDIDFSVWGPFNQEEVCETPNDIVDFITNNQPIRSSWAGGADPTGLADINPVTGLPVEDEFDCAPIPGANGDDFASTIPALEGEVYVILVNDWGNQIGDGGIAVDWGPSDPDILAPVEPIVLSGSDTAICAGESIQIEIQSGIESIEWIGDTATLSCLNCLDPIATPSETTNYQAVIDAVCYEDTIIVKVQVFDVTAGPDQTVCRNEEIQIVAGSNFEDATYEWQAPAEVSLSCTDCPNPFIIADQSGTHEIIVSLIAPTCTLTDTMELTVLEGLAPGYEIADDAQVCIGEAINIGGTFVPGTSYSWTSIPPGFSSDMSNPEVSPTETTTYYLEVSGIDALCPLPSTDSILVEVFELPTVTIAEDTTLCQGEPLILGTTAIEEGVVYEWMGPGDIEDASNPNTLAFPQESGTYTLTATRGACVVEASFEVNVAIIDVEILEADTLQICLGTAVDLAVNASPANIEATWTPDDGSLSNIVGNSIVATPEVPTTYIAQVEIPGCIKQDTITILVDSLPSDLSIEPVDTTVCIGTIIVFSSPIYEPSDFQNINFDWSPTIGFESPDSLYNLVISAQETLTYTRLTTNGVCEDLSTVKINVDTIPNVSISPMDTVICGGESVDIVVTADGALEEIEWTPEGLSCTDCLTPTATPFETTTYTMTASSGTCGLSISTDIGVSDQPFVDLSPDQTICLGESLQLNFANDALTTYEWSSPNDPSFTSTDPALVVNPAQTTTYVLAATNGCGTIEDQVTITVLSDITLTVSEDQLVCSGDDITINASSNLPDGNDATYRWEWESGNTSVGPDLEINGITETTSFKLVFEYECGEIEEMVVITVNQAPSVSFPADPTICFSGNLNLNEDPNVGLAYSWSSPDDPDFSSNEADPVVSPDVTTTYNVVASIDGCPDFEGSVTVLVIEQASVSISMDTTICEGDQVELVAVGTAPEDVPQSYTWLVDGVEVGNEATLVQTPSADTEYVLIYNYGLDCEVLTETVMVFVEENISIEELIVVPNDGNFPIQIDIGIVDTITAIVSPPDQELTYTWTVNEEDYGGNTAIITHTSSLGGPVTYAVTVTNNIGCTDEAAVTVEFIAPTVAIPNVFTPNGDNKNDFFFPVSSGGVEVIDMKVFNRWGQLVFDNDDLDRGWDGTYNGKPAPSDVYIYKISYKKVDTEDAEIFEEKGDVSLLR